MDKNKYYKRICCALEQNIHPEHIKQQVYSIFNEIEKDVMVEAAERNPQQHMVSQIKNLGGEKIKGIANKIVNKIVADLTDRRGLKHEFESYNPDIQNEIENTWNSIVVNELRGVSF